jgi:hypothetical protein
MLTQRAPGNLDVLAHKVKANCPNHPVSRLHDLRNKMSSEHRRKARNLRGKVDRSNQIE